jgi:zinc protease
MFGGGGISNKTSRLYQALVEKEYAVGVHGGVQLSVDPYLYEVMLTVHPERTVNEVLTHFDDEIKIILDKLVTEAEIKRAMKQAKALFAYGSENITNQAFWMGYAEMFADYSWFQNYIDRLSQVTPDDVMRIAQKYLSETNRTIGIYIPDEKKEEAS